MTARAPDLSPLSTDYQRLLEEWCRLWGVDELGPEIRVEISARMTRSLGRCYPDRKLIRIAELVLQESDELLVEVLCHEAAHVAAHHLHGRSIRPHGRAWKELVRRAGHEPTVRYQGSILSRVPSGTPRKSLLDVLFEGLQGVFLKNVRSPAFKKRRR